ncbi:aldo/keto reductase [Alphaproteobacteria bacterium]|nr:aldo/keto reductase [Alphaproteobacteria bacterium]
MENQFSKIILGTVQLGMPYGLGPWKSELMPEATAFSILDAAWDSGITTLDTSSNYGVAEERICKFMRLNPSKNFDLISKVKSQNKVSARKHSCFDDWQRTSPLLKIESKNSLSLLLHDENDVNCELTVEVMQQFQVRGLVSSWGVSIYSTGAALKAAEIGSCQIVQLPFGVLNQTFRNNGVCEILRQRNKTIHARSIFTKGLLFAKNTGPASTSSEVLETIEFIESLGKKEGLTLMQYATNFVMSFDEINSILIGVDTPKQLNEIIKSMDRPNTKFELDMLSDYVKRLAPDDVRPEKWK